MLQLKGYRLLILAERFLIMLLYDNACTRYNQEDCNEYFFMLFSFQNNKGNIIHLFNPLGVIPDIS